MKYWQFILSLLFSVSVSAQHTLTVHVTSLPDSHADEDIFISGNFNMWRPNEDSMKLSKNPDGTYSFSLYFKDVPSDRLEFKFTRGSWQTSECTQKGRLEAPRLALLEKDTTISCAIEGWRDDFPASTASENVHILDTAFYIPQLDRRRQIWIYLPKDYQTSGKKYPVLYMHDGQHLFDEATSVGRIGPVEWSVDETLDNSETPCIIVGINHNPDMKKRVTEYYYHPNEDSAVAEGKAYLEFITRTLKPYVDKNYRTLSDKSNTGIAGSSMGGLISLYAGIKYPKTFGWMGLFSPSVWLDYGNIENDISQLKKSRHINKQHYFFYAGKSENRQKKDKTFVNMTDDVNRVIGLLKEKAQPEIQLSVHPTGRHGALYWREAFPAFYNWFIQNAGK